MKPKWQELYATQLVDVITGKTVLSVSMRPRLGEATIAFTDGTKVRCYGGDDGAIYWDALGDV